MCQMRPISQTRPDYLFALASHHRWESLMPLFAQMSTSQLPHHHHQPKTFRLGDMPMKERQAGVETWWMTWQGQRHHENVPTQTSRPGCPDRLARGGQTTSHVFVEMRFAFPHDSLVPAISPCPLPWPWLWI